MDPETSKPPYQSWPPQPESAIPAYHPISPGQWPGQPHPPRRSFWSTTGGAWTIVGIVLGGIAVILGVVAVVAVGMDRQAAKNMDVKITGCHMENEFVPTATVDLTVTNRGSQARGATVYIEYRDTRGERIDTDTSRIDSIAPGDTAHKQEITFLDADPGPTGTCKIVGVS